MRTPALPAFKKWAKAHYSLAHAVCVAQAFAECQRERVDAYVQPIFDSFGFHYRGDLAEKCNLSGPIPSVKELYLCDDEAQLALFYEACDQAHAAHGFKGEKGHCPALVAEHILIIAENALMEAANPLFDADFVATAHFENRRKLLDCLLGACLKTEERRAA